MYTTPEDLDLASACTPDLPKMPSLERIMLFRPQIRFSSSRSQVAELGGGDASQ